jgi:Flp pilus assembly protein TadB
LAASLSQWSFPVALLLALALAGILLPNLTIRSEAARRRRSFNHSLSAFLDLVAVNLAAGRGIEGALDTAAEAGRGWAFGEIRLALYRAKVNQPNLLTRHNRRRSCSQAFSC